MRSIRLFFLFFIASLLAPIACASSGTRPCYEPQSTVRRPPICRNPASDICKARKAMVRARFSSTVSISVSRFTPETGIRHFSGTGVVIDDAGRVLTAAHVVSDAYQGIVFIKFRQLAPNEQDTIRLREMPMLVTRTVPEYDVALLYPLEGGPFPPPIPLAKNPPKIGDAVMHFGRVSGFSFGAVENPNISRNNIHGLLGVAINCHHGDSGGPLVLLEDGQLIGTLILKDPNVSYSYFTPIQKARELLSF